MDTVQENIKTAELVKQAFMKVEGNLSEIHIFHTDRGNEFKNETIEELLETFHTLEELKIKLWDYVMGGIFKKARYR